VLKTVVEIGIFGYVFGEFGDTFANVRCHFCDRTWISLQ
jgi:hypothetical protein